MPTTPIAAIIEDELKVLLKSVRKKMDDALSCEEISKHFGLNPADNAVVFRIL